MDGGAPQGPPELAAGIENGGGDAFGSSVVECVGEVSDGGGELSPLIGGVAHGCRPAVDGLLFAFHPPSDCRFRVAGTGEVGFGPLTPGDSGADGRLVSSAPVALVRMFELLVGVGVYATCVTKVFLGAVQVALGGH